MKNKFASVSGSAFGFFLLLIQAVIMQGCADNTRSIPGDLDKFDPIESLGAVSAFAGEKAVLYELSLRLVKPDGTLDFTQNYDPRVEYGFIVAGADAISGAGDKDMPLGVNRTVWKYVTVIITKPHWDSNSKGSSYNQGMKRIQSIFDPPDYLLERIVKMDEAGRFHPTPSEIWAKAIELGAPRNNAVADINCNFQGYRFKINGTDYAFQFELDGALVEQSSHPN
jgi:hypothetical protein